MLTEWQKVWRRGIAPQLKTAELKALRRALRTDDKRLLQGATTTPPPYQVVQDWPVEGADAITYGFVAVRGGFAVEEVKERGRTVRFHVTGGVTVKLAEEFFMRVCFECDRLCEEPAACRWFLNWYDETPRAEAFAALLAEVDIELTRRLAPGLGMLPDTPPAVFADYCEEHGLPNPFEE